MKDISTVDTMKDAKNWTIGLNIESLNRIPDQRYHEQWQ